MPPKVKKPEGPSKKTENKKKDKVIEDKTFGLKNKKGAKQQKFIKHVVTQVQHGGASNRKLELLNATKLTDKEKRKAAQEELNMLFKPVEQKVAKGVDAKSVLCAFFKQGQCGKGDRCKFSHDLNIGRRGEKRSMYDGEEKPSDNMEDWDEAKLEEVVNKKHGEKNKAMPKTAIICKFFLEALENSKYGWFWECPSGTCHYRHALPPGFELKKDKKAREDRKEVISLEELIERERAALSSDNLTRVTLETFLRWKKKKRSDRKEKLLAEETKKKSNFKEGKLFGISGRDMFAFNPDLIAGDDDYADETVYQPERDSDDEEDVGAGPRVKTIDLSTMTFDAQEADGSGTSALADRLHSAPTENGTDSKHDERTLLDEAAAIPPGAAAMATTSDLANGDLLAGDMPIDIDLFDGEDLDFAMDELERLELDN